MMKISVCKLSGGKMSLAYTIISDLWRLPRHFASSGYDEAVAYLKKILPFREIKFTSEDECNGWIIPPKWEVLQALIIKDNKIILDGMKHPLSVVSHSLSFEGNVDLKTLKQHLHYDNRYNDAIPYHFRYSYRPWDRDWGFCVTKNFYESLEDGIYSIKIKTLEDEPELKIIDYRIQGESDYEFLFVAHLDHPGMANDDLSGCAVGCELMNELSKQKTKFSYRLILVQEIIGSQLYLEKIFKNNIIGGVFLEMLGVNINLSMQSSYAETSSMDYFLKKALKEYNCENILEFKSIIGNDELVFESYGIPMPSLIRFPYPEYHCDKDNIDIIEQSKLSEAIAILLKMVEFIEDDIVINKKFKGVMCLSNPNCNLYVDSGQPAFGKNDDNIQMRRVMDYLSIMPETEFLSILCHKFKINKNVVYEYLKKWADHHLIEMI